MKFEVGDIWRDGRGEEFEVVEITGSAILPVRARQTLEGRTYLFRGNGQYHRTQSARDLIKKVMPTLCPHCGEEL